MRAPSAKELKATSVIEVIMEEASAKERTGPPVDDKADYELDVWTGVLPVDKKYGNEIADENLKEGIPTPNSVNQLKKVEW